VEIALGAVRLSEEGVEIKSNEEALVSRCKKRDASAFAELIDSYQSRVYGYVRRMLRDHTESEDVAQEVFVKAFQNIDRFDGRASFATWIFRIAANLCIDRARKRDRRPEMVPFRTEGGPTEVDPADLRWDPQAYAVTSEMHVAVDRAVSELSDKLRSVLLLHDLEGMSYEEIAATLGIPVGTVKSRLFLARMRLQQALAPFVIPEEAV
jgi:RNA polymerase sigma-70 factor (ECF subfamily)